VEYAFIGLSRIKKRVKSNQFTYNPQVQTEDVILNSVNPDPEKCLGQILHWNLSWRRREASRLYGINLKSIPMLEWRGMDKVFSQPDDTLL
jgi:hypothetical protein